ncbi:DUF2064 domain-containing protein [Gillisia sp. JM1]|uniref:TIGR04282 family arsenosugar biosynthesis glycosyltransferase n=1 Tax=Gillisia sp. JM1 TaxID=1283286 RepID=UPI000419D9D8|nr:DUF2064 domain-containing protein [Gillisia sp. JM1]
MIQQKTAVLIFANSPGTEGINKSFSFGSDLFASLNDRTIKMVEKTGLPYFRFSEKDQIGNCFGDRFTNAIQSVIEMGYENVITVGNDTPSLSKKHIIEAAAGIDKFQIVLGPSQDGGFYLMGLHRSQFNTEIFKTLPWQTSRLNNALENHFLNKRKVKIKKLEMLFDIDSLGDLKNIQEKINQFSVRLKTAILKLLFSTLHSFSLYNFHFLQVERTLIFNKGSPSISSH